MIFPLLSLFPIGLNACANLSDKFKETAEYNSIDAQLKSMVHRVQEWKMDTTEKSPSKTGFYATSPFWQVCTYSGCTQTYQ